MPSIENLLQASRVSYAWDQLVSANPNQGCCVRYAPVPKYLQPFSKNKATSYKSAPPHAFKVQPDPKASILAFSLATRWAVFRAKRTNSKITVVAPKMWHPLLYEYLGNQDLLQQPCIYTPQKLARSAKVAQGILVSDLGRVRSTTSATAITLLHAKEAGVEFVSTVPDMEPPTVRQGFFVHGPFYSHAVNEAFSSHLPYVCLPYSYPTE